MSATSSVIITLFILLLIGCGLLCFSNLSRLHLKRHIIPLIIVLLLSLYCFYPINKSYFMGLEYEDAYIFSASARFMQEDRGSYPDPLRTRSCVMGSLSNCEMSAVYGGHFLAVPSLALASHRLLGYSPYTICIINGTAAILSILVLYALCFQITGDIALSFISSLIYAVVPIMTVFHTSALGETYSSLIVLIYGFCFIALFIKSEQLRSLFAIACWIVLFLSFVLALLTKRENLIIVAMPLFALLSLPSKRLRDNKGLIAWAIASLVIAVAVSVAFQIVQAEANEATDIGSATFSLGYFLALLPLFTKSFITVRWFMAASLFVVLGLWALRHRFYIRSERDSENWTRG
jgi:hypothetical protein